nr:unnamed protein product [Callosobruchus analis]
MCRALDVTNNVVEVKKKTIVWSFYYPVSLEFLQLQNAKGKKWYKPIVFWLLDLCATYTWLLAREYGYTEDNLLFRKKTLSNFAFEIWKKLYGSHNEIIVNGTDILVAK